jgi:hypothetical protein
MPKSAVVAAASLWLCACGGGKKHDLSRFIVEIDDVLGGVTVTVAGKPVPLENKGLYGSKELRGLVDFKESEVPAKTTRPVVMLSTPCGPKAFEYPARVLAPPNESNVVVLRMHRNDLPKITTFIFAPSVKGPVSVGDIAVSPIPPQLDVFEAGCGKPITVGTESSPIESGHRAIAVAASAQACLKTGVRLYGSGPGCEPDSARTLTGSLVYPLEGVPSTLFKGVDDSVEVRRSTTCTNRTWLQEC